MNSVILRFPLIIAKMSALGLILFTPFFEVSTGVVTHVKSHSICIDHNLKLSTLYLGWIIDCKNNQMPYNIAENSNLAYITSYLSSFREIFLATFYFTDTSSSIIFYFIFYLFLFLNAKYIPHPHTYI